MNLQNLKEQRSAKLIEMRNLNDKALSESRDLSEKELGCFNQLDSEIRNLDSQIERTEKLVAYERLEASGNPVGGADMRSLTQGFSLAKAVTETLSGRLTGREAEYAQERRNQGSERTGNGLFVSVPTTAILGNENRALTTTTPVAGPGGNLVATELATMTDRRRAPLKIELLGAVILRNLTGNLDLPRLKASGTASWVAEHNAATRTDSQFEKKSLSPKTVTAEYELSRRMLLQSNEALETILRADLSYLLSQALDSVAIQGGGTNEPVGILADSDVQSVTGGAFDSNICADLLGALETDDVSGTLGFLTNPAVITAARKIKDDNGHPIPIAELFHAVPVEVSTQVPSDIGTVSDKNALICGEWASLYLGYWSGVDLLLNPYHTDVASKGGVLLHAFLDCDVVVRHPEGFRYAEID